MVDAGVAVLNRRVTAVRRLVDLDEQPVAALRGEGLVGAADPNPPQSPGRSYWNQVEMLSGVALSSPTATATASP